MVLTLMCTIISLLVFTADSQWWGNHIISPTALINGGTDAPNHRWPWHVSIQKHIRDYEDYEDYEHMCSGILVSNKMLLSYRECYNLASLKQKLISYKAVVGSVAPYISDKEGFPIPINSYVDTLYEFVLLRLAFSVTNKFAKPVHLAKKQVKPGTKCYVTGFSKNGRKAVVKVVRADLKYIFTIGDHNPTVNVKYDKGGPLVCYNADSRNYELQGMAIDDPMDDEKYGPTGEQSVFAVTTSPYVYEWLMNNSRILV